MSRFIMNNFAPKLSAGHKKIAFKIIRQMLKEPFLLQSSTLPKDAPSKFYLSTTFGLSLIIISVAPARSSTSYAYSELQA